MNVLLAPLVALVGRSADQLFFIVRTVRRAVAADQFDDVGAVFAELAIDHKFDRLARARADAVRIAGDLEHRPVSHFS